MELKIGSSYSRAELESICGFTTKQKGILKSRMGTLICDSGRYSDRKAPEDDKIIYCGSINADNVSDLTDKRSGNYLLVEAIDTKNPVFYFMKPKYSSANYIYLGTCKVESYNMVENNTKIEFLLTPQDKFDWSHYIQYRLNEHKTREKQTNRVSNKKEKPHDKSEVVRRLLQYEPAVEMNYNSNMTDAQISESLKKGMELRNAAINKHEKLITSVYDELIAEGIPPENFSKDLEDLIVHADKSISIYEFKTCNKDNMQSQLMKAIGQILFYEQYRYSNEINSGIVINKYIVIDYSESTKKFKTFELLCKRLGITLLIKQ